MNIGVVILARLTSSRLPGKGLRLINGKPLLSHIIEAVKSVKEIKHIILATSQLSSDDELESFADEIGVKVYRGSLDNVSERFLDACLSNGLDYGIRINGDNLFVNTPLLSQACSLVDNERVLITNVPDRTFPKGMSVEILKVQEFEKLYRKFNTPGHFEHVTSYLYENLQNINHEVIRNEEYPKASGKQIAIDTQYDFYLAQYVLSELDKQGLDAKSVSLDKLIDVFNRCESKMNFKGKHGPLLIAEIGGNHEGDFDYAKKLTQLAIDSDSDFIKFQIYSGNTLVNPVESPDRHKHFKKFELSKEQYRELAQIVTDAGKKFMASIWDIDMIDWVDDYNPVYKIGSGDLLAWPLLKHVANSGKPIILSTGLATEEEVLASVKYLRDCNALYNDPNYLSVLQCTSMYPIPKASANLGVMTRLHELTETTMGYSDHTEGSDALKVAIAMGAQVLEYHFTDSRDGKVFRDHKVSLTKDEVLELIEYIKMVSVLKGNSTKKPVPIEIENGHVESFRRAVYPSRNIQKGEVIRNEDLVILRPSHGISSRYFDELLGKVATKALKKHQVLSMSDFS
ncbi:hypothetical protein tloyanaT_29010 [Thalassotalea loyana]|uniref:AFP-like domain-containing protein n=1 Tax=Thalassotalea loyana TaxID=280483 RepID=A0ABQ6HEV6_9GAMM|nr:N-acetylneuraminate synthase family protein [Thalassotalea loyana]GLX86648.1 hypothetical protein tloyanaT_29010 [Thalassotalea loyana]